MSVTKVTDAMRNVTAVDATKISGAVPSASLTNVDLSKLEYNQAILAFKVASANQLAKFQMVDQVIDEYQDATGIDASASTNEFAQGTGTAKYYEGGADTSPTITQNANTTGTEGDYTWYQWTSGSSGSFESSVSGDVEVLVVAGGGAGGNAGGGAGGYRTDTSYAVTGGSAITSITVGAGGAVGGSNAAIGGTGGSSTFGTITSAGGGGGGGYGTTYAGAAGGSGGGGNASGGAGGAGNTPSTSPVQGYAGGAGGTDASTWTGGGGGGGAASVGLAPVPGAAGNHTTVGGNDGGAGIANDITGTSLFYAGGGGGGYDGASNGGGTGGSGVGGNGGANDHADESATAATANRGSGGGGISVYSRRTAGSAGVVVVRLLTTTTSSGSNLTLQSVATTAESAPTTADLVMLIEDNEGTATINTDIKAKVSRDGSAFSGYVTLVDEGDWGTDKRILVARNIDISGIASGVAMKYKIETFNQSAGSKETRIHATSLAWA